MEKDKSQTIEKIINSQTFANKEVLKGLFVFLFESLKKKEALKEVDIAVDYFKRGKDFLPGEDTIVRVNIHKLRTLLEKYYLDEGKNEEIILEIPKGNYTINFLPKGHSKVAVEPTRSKILLFLIALLAISVLLHLIVFFYSGNKKEPKNNPVWSGYIQSGLPVYVTLGDPFFFRIKDSSSQGNLIIRDIDINSEDDLKNSRPRSLQEKGKQISELTYPYFSKNNVWPLPDILSVFSKTDIEIRLQALSESNMEDIKRNNVIFIGNINSFGFMNKFLEQTSIRLFTNPRQISIGKGKDSLLFTVPEQIKGSYVDYAFLVKLPGSNNNFISMMGDFHASGMKGLSNYITREKTLNELEKKIKEEHGTFPDYFEMVVKVTSYNYSDFETKLIHFKPLEKK